MREEGNKVIDKDVTEWLDGLRLTVDLFDSFAKYAAEQGAVSMFGGPSYLTADFPNGWSASAGLVQLGGGVTYVKFASRSSDVMSYKAVKNDWRAAVDRAVSGGAA